MARNEAMLFDDYIKLRNAKVGEKVTLSDGREIVKNHLTVSGTAIGSSHKKPGKWTNLDFYDNTYY